MNLHNSTKCVVLRANERRGNAMSSIGSCYHIADCIESFSETDDSNKVISTSELFKIVKDSRPFTMDQLVFHCSNTAQKATLTEDEMIAIISGVRRRNA
jgi:hypothetical protein